MNLDVVDQEGLPPTQEWTEATMEQFRELAGIPPLNEADTSAGEGQGLSSNCPDGGVSMPPLPFPRVEYETDRCEVTWVVGKFLVDGNGHRRKIGETVFSPVNVFSSENPHDLLPWGSVFQAMADSAPALAEQQDRR